MFVPVAHILIIMDIGEKSLKWKRNKRGKMQTKDIIIPYKISDSTFKLYALGDIHAGTIHCVEEDIKRKVAEIAKERNAYWIGMGDYAEFITPKDKRFDPSQKAIAEWCKQDNIAHDQTEWIYKLFKPIAKKCVGLLYGNHEESMRIFNHDNVQQNICEDLGVDNLGFSCFLRMYLGEKIVMNLI